MALARGTRLGVYEIIAAIGEGGMGAVYRARDIRLDRDVAIKVLPKAFAHDAGRLARFTREARTLASLNHSNIAHIHGLEESEGTTALVMELVEGDDLSERIAAGAISIDEALPIAKQIADALEAAHEQGIIHRDLKPANIKVRSDGTVKVLDFGLAKAIDQSGGSGGHDLSASPTLTSPAMTQPGVILGTAAYMAPEQAKGRPVDRRADIWAFGCVLYEMLTGTRAFPGENVTDTIVSVMSKEPDFAALPADVPARVSQALRVCLRKDVQQRAHDIADVRLAFDGAFETTAPQTMQTTTAAPRGRPFMMAALAVTTLLVAAMAAPTLRHLRETPPPPPLETRLEISTPATDQPGSFALSPDGRQIVFVASDEGVSRLWVRSLAATTAQPLKGTEDATDPFWSPDGRSVGFFAGNVLKRLDLGASVAQTLAPVITGLGGTWNADGVIVFGAGLSLSLMRVSASGGAVTTVTTLGPGREHSYPQFLPDGRRFLFFQRSGPDTTGIYLGALDGGIPTRLTPAADSGGYLPAGRGRAGASADGGARSAEASSEGGWLLWVRASTLVAQPLDVAKATLTGEPVTLAEAASVGLFGQSAVSVARTGLVAYRTGGGSSVRQLTWFDRSGSARGTVGEADSTLFQPRVSPDGRRVVVQREARGNTDLWLLDDGRASRFTFDAATEIRPTWSPDGTRIAFASSRTGRFDLYQKLTSGAGVEERVLASDQTKAPSGWSADGRFLLFNSTDPATSFDIWVVPMVGDHTPSLFLKTPFRELHGVFSPDGRWVAYQSNESGRDEVYVRPFVPPTSATGAATITSATTGGQWQVSTGGGIHPAWRRDGKELYYLNAQGAMMSVSIATGATPSPGAPVVLFSTRIVGGGVDRGVGRQYDVAPDGRFLINTELPSNAAPITLIQHWNPEAKK